MEGRPFLGQNLTAPRNYIYAGRDRMDERYDMQRCVRDKQYKYIRYYEPYKSFCQYMNTPEKGAIMQAIRQAEVKWGHCLRLAARWLQKPNLPKNCLIVKKIHTN